MEEELKPVNCGCGGPVSSKDYICVETTNEEGFPIIEPVYRVFCRQCGISTPFAYPSKSDAIRAWNRAMSAELRSNCEALRSCAAPWDPDRNRYCCEICGHYVGKYDAFCGGCGAKLTDYSPDGRGKKK